MSDLMSKLLASRKEHHTEFSMWADDLDRAIIAVEKATGITDPGHFAYPPFCTAARIRLAALRESIAEAAQGIAELEGRAS